MSQNYQTRQRFTEKDNLSGPIRTGHNQHTHTGNTRQPELNSRVPRVHPPSRAQLEGYVPSSVSYTRLDVYKRRLDVYKRQHTHTGNTRQPELNSRVPRVHPPSRAQLERCHFELNSRNTAWQGIRTAKRQAPQTHKVCNHRHANAAPGDIVLVAVARRDFSPPSSVTNSQSLLFNTIAWWFAHYRQAP
ncbi:hypothetical protein DEO72_LG3g574 [Vigna unguiculata]|uniref:Uncharacterized protein n=1 Tax=Vigna unguiculata TaxID=3917 RepID=A0A4D6LC33_VIGUN|nr:hypothetical protein DEO72_LG3g574 [Vigna unguiculata]